MVTWVRTAGIEDGKLKEAIGWAKKVAEYVNAHFQGSNVMVFRNVGGLVYEIHWVGTCESLAAYDELWKRVEADAGYQKLLDEMREAELFEADTVIDRIYESI